MLIILHPCFRFIRLSPAKPIRIPEFIDVYVQECSPHEMPKDFVYHHIRPRKPSFLIVIIQRNDFLLLLPKKLSQKRTRCGHFWNSLFRRP
ncbi:hypothetical protein B4135_3362 [Caldibacillus debilis]|uniref:Uncharacterized protein n=1 Tax=Caldibacillus debilis TaxID=301148 RepID=A0A150LGU3_9BACI|nr:hypothetical protein B4135_3362 [Caldibacillus debilis]